MREGPGLVWEAQIGNSGRADGTNGLIGITVAGIEQRCVAGASREGSHETDGDFPIHEG